MSAKYWIAQLIEDVFRNEPRNVGVFVSHDGALAARFFGEVADQQVDGRKLRALSHPDVYKQWVQYWRRTCLVGGIEPIVRASGTNYRVVPGGEVSDVGTSNAEEIATYLYALLVSDGGFREALGAETEDSNIALEADLSQAFRARNIFGEQDPQIRHPVRRGVPVLGAAALEHKPTFVQENGSLYLMEPVDFTARQKRRSLDHAGLSAYMFKDIRAARHGQGIEAIAVVKVTDEERELEDVHYGLRLLGNECRVVNWLDHNEQRAFLDERVQVAHG